MYLPKSEPPQNIIENILLKPIKPPPHNKIMRNYILEYHKWIETHFKLLYSLYSLCYLCHLINVSSDRKYQAEDRVSRRVLEHFGGPKKSIPDL